MRAATGPGTLAMAVVLVAAGCSTLYDPPPTPSPVGAPSASAASTTSPGTACTPPTTPAAHDWNERTWYELFVRSFADGDGDGFGDLKGLASKLDYLNDGDPSTTTDLGVGGLWLMPIAESPSYHGYDVTDYRRVEPDYGTRADLEALIAGAHERGIKVIVDLVLNHTSSEHPWFTDAGADTGDPADWYLWSDSNPGWLGPGGQVAWHELDGRWYYGVFSDRMPDLNLRSEAVTAELEDVARFWLAEVGVDGFRLDAAKHLIEDGKDAQTNTPETHEWLAGFKASVDGVDPDAMLVGEVWDPASIAGGYVPDSLDLTFDFGLATAYRTALQNGRAAPIRTALLDTAARPANQAASFLTNHDQTRIMTQLRGDPEAAKLAAFLLLTGPGTPFLYYGEEIGMTGTKPDERIRTPMRWTPDPATAGFTTGEPWEALSDDDPASVNVEAQTADRDSLLATYQDLVRIRTQQPALRVGATTIVDSNAEPVIGWLRTTAGATVLALVNVSDQPVDAYTLSLAAGPLCGPQVATLLGAVNGDPGAAITPPTVNDGGGVDAWTPVARLPARSGFLVSLAPAP